MENVHREVYRGKSIVVRPHFDLKFGLYFSATVEDEDWEIYCGENAQEQFVLLKRDIDRVTAL